MDVLIAVTNPWGRLHPPPSTTRPAPPPRNSLEAASELRPLAEEVAGTLRAALERVVLDLLGVSPRPADLIARTGLDKSLAGRIVQTIRTPDPLTVLQRSPAPNGLRMFLRAAANAGGGEGALGAAEEAVRGLEALLSRFSGGRAGLEAAISGWLPEARDQGERAARQAVFRAMSFLFGHQADVSVLTTIIQPSADGVTCDLVYVRGYYGLRRLRVGEPLAIAAMRLYPVGVPGVEPVRVETIGGESGGGAGWVLREFCSRGAPELEVVETKEMRHLVLPADRPGLNEPISVVTAQVSRRGWQRYASEARREEWQTILPRIPSRVLMSDMLIHEDVYRDVEPILTTHMVGLSPVPARERNPSFRLDEIELSAETGWLGSADSDLSTGEIPRYPELIASVFGSVGWDRSRFRTHRIRMNYPVQGVALTRWIPLGLPPGLVGGADAAASEGV